MGEERIAYFLIAVVAIVAVVGLVTMFMMSAGTYTSTPYYVVAPTALRGEDYLMAGSAVAGTGNVTVSCNDTDGGKNYYIQGTTTWGPIGGKFYSATDSCDIYGRTLSEMYCYYSWNLKGYYSTVDYYYCPYGCENGTCRQIVNRTVRTPKEPMMV